MRSVSEKAKIGDNVHIGEFVVIEDSVVIGDNCEISHGVIIKKDSIIGANVRIDENAVIGKRPMRAATSIVTEEKEITPCIIDDGVLVGAGAIIYCGCIVGKASLIADLATVRENVTIGEKTIIGRGAAIENDCIVGSFCKLETNAYITAYSMLGDHVFIAPGVVTSNDNFAGRTKERLGKLKGVTVEDGGRIGAQATILPGKTIHEEGFAAAGSIVTKDVEKGMIVAGNPAVFLKKVPDGQLLKNQ